MEPNHKNDKPEEERMQRAHRRTDTALIVISITLAAAFIGLGAYAAIWHIILPLLGVNQCS